MIVKLKTYSDDGKKTIRRDLFSAQGTHQQGGTAPYSGPHHHQWHLERDLHPMFCSRRQMEPIQRTGDRQGQAMPANQFLSGRLPRKDSCGTARVDCQRLRG